MSTRTNTQSNLELYVSLLCVFASLPLSLFKGHHHHHHHLILILILILLLENLRFYSFYPFFFPLLSLFSCLSSLVSLLFLLSFIHLDLDLILVIQRDLDLFKGYEYIYIYTHIHTYIHISIYTYVHQSIHTSTSPYIRPSVHTYLHQSTHTSILPSFISSHSPPLPVNIHITSLHFNFNIYFTYIHINIYILIYILICLFAYIHTHTHTYIHAYSHPSIYTAISHFESQIQSSSITKHTSHLKSSNPTNILIDNRESIPRFNTQIKPSIKPSLIKNEFTRKRIGSSSNNFARSTAGSSTGPTSDEAYRAVAPSHVSRAPARTQISHTPQSKSVDHPPFRRAETFPRVVRRETYAGHGHAHGHPGAQVSVRRDMSRDEEETVYVDEVEKQDQEKEKAKEKEKEKNGGLFGMTNKALVGTFLGAAAGAAFAYAMVKSEDPEYELESERKAHPGLRRSHTTGHAETIASSNRGGSAAGTPDRRYRVIEAPMPPPASNYSRIQRDREREREGVLSPIEERSYYSSVPPSNSGSKMRRGGAEQGEGSNAGTARPPTAINVRDKPQSIAPSRVSEKTSTVKAVSRAPTQVSRAPVSQVSVRESEYEYGNTPTHVSGAHNRHAAQPRDRERERERSNDAKSQVSHTHTTIKFSPSKTGSRPAPSHVSERERERIPRSEATWERDDGSSVVSDRSRARDVPLPASTVVSARYGGGYREQGSGYTHAGMTAPSCIDRGVDEDGKSYFNPRGAMSVAPSDSVSSVGSKRERIERLRGRLERDLRV
ncbi:hypothetical protein EYC80_007683 [Monilinia laxa]|uniref:Uncharacterized protein n=1 Tax=Monilinia laxa TaxID=61186 RepID=A0A5N6JWN0_MONLA|nr:hypothetical protein EYC80_007683 [Monilinia laxa]